VFQRLSSRRSLLILAGIVAIGLLLRVWGLGWGLQNADVSRRPHPDEWAVYWLFHWFQLNGNLNPCSHTHGQCFLDWGMAFPYAAYGVHQVLSAWLGVVSGSGFGPRADPQFVSATLDARIASVIFSTATIPVAYLLGRTAYGDAVGLLGALLVALSALFIQLAHFGTPDSLTNLLLGLALWAMISASNRPSIGRFAAAGALVGAATASEYHMVLLAIPLVGAWILARDRSMRSLAISAACAVTVFLAINPYILLDFPAFVDATLHTLRVRTVDSGVQYDGRWAPYGPGWLYVTRYALGFGVGYPLTVLMVGGAVWAAVRRRRSDLILLCWLVPYFVLLTVSPAKFVRYSAPLLIPLAILAGRAVVDAWGVARGRRRAGVAGLAAAVMIFTLMYDAAYAGLFASLEPRSAAAQVIESTSAKGAQIAFEAPADGLLNLPYFFTGSAVQACSSAGNLGSLSGVEYLAFDQFASDEVSPAGRPALLRFRESIATGGRYALVVHVNYIPTFLGFTFPIAGSPHDWRYPSHEITIFRLKTPDPGHSRVC
jgi:hypothetical protein